MKITNPKNGEVFTSRFNTTSEAHAALQVRIDANEFGQRVDFPLSILTATAKPSGQTPGRLFWLHKLANEGAKPAPKASGKFNLTGLLEMFSRAKANGLKFPGITLTLSNKVEVKLSVASERSRYCGQLMVKATTYPGPYYGRVDTDGAFYQGRDFTPEVGKLLADLASDPKHIAGKQGHLTGRCCFCRKLLDDPKSTALGYGPTCAKKFGLVHGKVEADAKRDMLGLPLETERKVKRVRKIERA